MKKSSYLALLTCLTIIFSSLLSYGDDMGVTSKELELYRLFINGTEANPKKFANLNLAKKIKTAARLMKVKLSKLKAAYHKVHPVFDQLANSIGNDIKNELESYNIRSRFGLISLKGRVDQVDIDLSSHKVVAFVKWKNQDRRFLQEEACMVAHAVKEKTKLVWTLALLANDKTKGTKQFTAKISTESMNRIKKLRIPMMADRKYINLFENKWFLYKPTR